MAKESQVSAQIEEIPAEYIIHPRIVVSRKTGEEMLRKAENPDPTPALRELMRDGDPGTPRG